MRDVITVRRQDIDEDALISEFLEGGRKTLTSHGRISHADWCRAEKIVLDRRGQATAVIALSSGRCALIRRHGLKTTGDT